MIIKLKNKFKLIIRNFYKILLAIFALMIAFQNAMAGGIPITTYVNTYNKTSNTETTVYAGLVWTLVKEFKKIPELTLGIRALKQETPFATSSITVLLTDENVIPGKPSTKIKGGLDFSLRFNFDNSFTTDSARLLYVDGKKDLLGNVGVGYSFTNSQPFGTLGLQADYSRVGMDVDLDNSMLASPQFFAELLTLGKIDEINPDCSSALETCVAVGELLE